MKQLRNLFLSLAAAAMAFALSACHIDGGLPTGGLDEIPLLKPCPGASPVAEGANCPPPMIRQVDRDDIDGLEERITAERNILTPLPSSAERTAQLAALDMLMTRLTELRTANTDNNVAEFNRLFSDFDATIVTFSTMRMTVIREVIDGLASRITAERDILTPLPSSAERTAQLAALDLLMTRLTGLRTANTANNAEDFTRLFSGFDAEIIDFSTMLMTAMKVCNSGMIPLADTCPPLTCGNSCPGQLAVLRDGDTGGISLEYNGGRTGFRLIKTGQGAYTTALSAVAGNDGVDPNFFAWGVFDALSVDDYLIFGIWNVFRTNMGAGGFVFGAPLANDYSLPISGSATYEGTGNFINDQAGGDIDVSFNATFNAGRATMSGEMMETSGGADSQVLFNMATDNNGVFTGTLTCGTACLGTSATSQWQGAFFGNAASGDAPTKFGGTFRADGLNIINNTAPTATFQFRGGFGAELQ